MSLATSFEITVHSSDINYNSDIVPVKLMFNNIAMRHPLTEDNAEIETRRAKNQALTRIHLNSAMRRDRDTSEYVKRNLDVLESNEEIDALIETAMAEHVQKLQKMRALII
ncbi:MAG: hypothetical protein VX740_07420 [Pseudomonadota bacterium]|jgi:hypothetical protein|nr:hypothetical protein [Pseudomonadota bacterium]MEC9236316.1 hypothetical protein [Pseudomonadota bacterium]MED5423253.1 hypothetical protein [Pseudomonadota bacterium]MEE3323657.1 hypothetical protein [Pseudomonadota bacterium]